MKKDIENRNDVELLVSEFYKKVRSDAVIGYIFNEVVRMDWKSHLQVMGDFWENTILFTGNYEGNPMELHKHLQKITPLTTEHFTQWNTLFVQTVNELFEGKNATLAKQRAVSISNVLQTKILK